jgi:hypothetical protein
MKSFSTFLALFLVFVFSCPGRAQKTVTDRLFSITENGRTGFIDNTGKIVIPIRFISTKGFSEGYSAVWLDGKWGYINRAGKMVIAPQFEDANNFSEGYAAVKIKEKWGYIDTAGNSVLMDSLSYRLNLNISLLIKQELKLSHRNSIMRPTFVSN